MMVISLGSSNYTTAKVYKGEGPTTLGADGKPLLSWRVHLLPYLEFVEGESLHSQFKFDEPWDSEHNKKLIAQMPDIYLPEGAKTAAEHKTKFVRVRSKDSATPDNEYFDERRITDNPAQTIVLVEAPDSAAVVWTKPDDWELDESDPTSKLTEQGARDFLAIFADGKVRNIPADIDPQLFLALVTCAGGEKIDEGKMPPILELPRTR